MPTRRLPNSTATVIRTLITARDAWKQFPNDRDVTATALPDLSSITAVLEAAAMIAPGEAARKAAEGAAHIPMALPSAAEVAAAHADATAKRAAAEAAKLNTDTQQGELAALYPEAQKLAVSLINTVEFQLGEREDLDDAGRRRIARLWGVVYLNDDGSAAEESGNDLPKTAPTATP